MPELLKQLSEEAAKTTNQIKSKLAAMQAGLSDHVWSIEELCALLPKPTVSTSKIEKDIVLKALGS